MSDAEKIAIVQAMIGCDDPEPVLFAYLSIAQEKILNRLYPFHEPEAIVPEKYQMLQCEIAVYLLKRGAEGQTAHSENGISRSYGSADVPEELMGRVVPFVGVM